MKTIYNIFVYLYPIFAKLLSSKSIKAKQWTEGRVDLFNKLEKAFNNNTSPVIWMHCSSLGEFEQGRPVLEQLKIKYAGYKIILTFFSPSGYEVQKNYTGADWIFYLPMDSKANARNFYNIVQPKLILFVKYEFWHYYLAESKQRNLPLLLISGIFRENQPFFKWYGSFHRKMLLSFTHFFLQTKESEVLLNSIGVTSNITVSGDTRFDRVIEIATKFTPLPLIEEFIGNNKVIVAGSTWTEDDQELAHYINANPTIKCIIAPHDIEAARISQCLSFFKNAVLFSNWKQSPTSFKDAQCLIIDNIGMLSKLYYYATICYVGGGFGNDGVHNVLEAAVYYKPVLFGPEYEKFTEAVELINKKGAISIDSMLELEAELENLLEDDSFYENTCNYAGNYVKENSGATEKIVQFIYENRLLTN